MAGIFTFTASSWLAAAPEAVFAFHCDPHNLVRLSPPGLRVLRLELPAAFTAGARIRLAVRVFGLWSQHWEVELAEVGPSRIVDQAVRSPFGFWRHTHGFVAEGSGTRLTDFVEYAPPGGRWGRLLWPVLQLQFTAWFRYRHWRTRQLLAGPAPDAITDRPA